MLQLVVKYCDIVGVVSRVEVASVESVVLALVTAAELVSWCGHWLVCS